MSKKMRKLLERLLDDPNNPQLDPTQLHDMAGLPDEAVKRAATKLGNRNFNEVVKEAGSKGGLPALGGAEKVPGLPGKDGAKEGAKDLAGKGKGPGGRGKERRPGQRDSGDTSELEEKADMPEEAGKGGKGKLDKKALEELAREGKVDPDALPADVKAKLRARGGGSPSAKAAVEQTQQARIDKQQVAQRLLEAVQASMTVWASGASINDVNVHGGLATGGRIGGPATAPTIVSRGPNGTPAESQITTALARAFDNAFLVWQEKFHIPGVELWPAFAAWPGPEAPPMPGLPMPLLAAIPHALRLSPPVGLGADPDEAIALAVRLITQWFPLWATPRMITTLMGGGRVPTFAPPYVPVGPVIGGKASMAPGHIS